MANEPILAPAIEAVAMAKHVRMSPQKVNVIKKFLSHQLNY